MRDIRAKKHGRKMIAPVVITGIVIIYYVCFFCILLAYMESSVLKWLLGIIPALLGATMVYVCVERIREIRGGEEDDLSQY